MTRAELLRKLETEIDDVIRQRSYCEIQIEFKRGEPTFLRRTLHEKLDDTMTENRNGRKF